MLNLRGSVLLIVFLSVFSTSLSGGYWSHRTKSLKGKHVYITKDGIRFMYLLIDSKHDGIIHLSKDRSCKFVFYRITKGNVTITIEKNGVVKKTLNLTKNVQTFRVHLLKGDYRIKSKKPVRLRFYIWRNVRLKNLQPVGGGYPVTLQVGDKRYAYYRVAGDTTISVRVKGKARVWAYFRPDVKSGETTRVYEIVILQDGKTLKRSRVILRPSKKAKYLENSKVTPGLPIRIPIHVKKGIHEYTLKVERGTGYAKFYLERPLKRKKVKHRKNVLKKKLGTGAIINPASGQVFLALFSFFPKMNNPDFLHGIKVTSELYYDSNPFKFSDSALMTIRANTENYLFTSVAVPHDIVLKMILASIFRYNKTDLSLRVLLYEYLKNLAKNSTVYGLSLSHRISRFVRFGADFYVRGKTFIRPVYTISLGYPAVFPLSYGYRKLNIWFRYSKLPSVLAWVRLSGSYVQYTYHYPFRYLSGFRNTMGISGKLELKKLSVYPEIQLGQYTANSHKPWEYDYSHLVYAFGIKIAQRKIVLKPVLDLGVERKTFLTPNEWDELHYQRVDFITRIGAGFTLPYPTDESLKLRFYFEQRKLSLPIGVKNEIFKDYRRWTLGIVYAKAIKWD